MAAIGTLIVGWIYRGADLLQCDGQKPACGQCMGRRVQCPGYATELKVVLVQPGVLDKTRTRAGESSKAVISRSPSKSPVPLELLPSLVTTAFRSQTYDRFITDYVPHATESWEKLPTDLAVVPSTSWLPAAITVAPTDPVLNNALFALALAQVGRRKGKPDLLLGSERFYHEAVSGLNKKLQDGVERLSDVTLTAAAVLSIYEVCDYTYDV